MFPRRCFFLLALLAAIPLLHAQTEDTNAPPPTFKSEVQVVLVDVVVTDKNDRPVNGLSKDLFQVLEQGKPQTISSFEEHGATTTSNLDKSEQQPLPPHIYSNKPNNQSSSAINIILLDTLNTPFEDQSTVYNMVNSFVKKMEPGPQFALVILSSRLSLVQGFTNDPQLILAALNGKNLGGTPKNPMLSSQAETNMNNQLLADIANNHGSQAAVSDLAAFLGEMSDTQRVSRVEMTLQSLRQLGQYLAGFPGRKNLIWFSASFPAIDFPATLQQVQVNDTGAAEHSRRTINSLASAQIAVYPIAAQGLETSPFYEASHLPAPKINANNAVESSIKELNAQSQQEREDHFFQQQIIKQIARNTGGEAFYDRNDLDTALGDAIHKGAHYYQISYSPTNKEPDGRYRNIEVKLQGGPYTISYRHGYFSQSPKEIKTPQTETESDPLHPLMWRGLPDLTEIQYRLRVLPTGTPASEAKPAGDSRDLHRAATRIGADFTIPLDDLKLELGSDGILHGNVELALVAYDRGGLPLNWLYRSIKTSLKPELHDAVEKTGVRFHQEIDVPEDEVYLRSGIYDLESHKAGTLEIPLSEADLGDIRSVSSPANANAPAVTNTPIPAPSRNNAASPDSNSKITKFSDTPAANIPPPLPYSSLPEQSATLPSPAEEITVNIPKYCATLTDPQEPSSALPKVCEFVLLLHRKLPDVICDREMKRHWAEFRSEMASQGTTNSYALYHNDVVTAKVTYKDGGEHYDNVRIDGRPIDTSKGDFSGASSDGEFADILTGIFSPLSKAEFHLEKKSGKVLVYAFTVAQLNNQSYYLYGAQKKWFPEYKGRIWIDKQKSQLIRMERETPHMADEPIVQMKTIIEYSYLPLGDGSNLTLPTHSDILICTPPANQYSNERNCSQIAIQFTNWHKFRAKTSIVTNSANCIN